MLKGYNLKLKYLPIEYPGYIIYTPEDQPNKLVVNKKLSDFEIENVILHEIGHELNDVQSDHRYKDNYRIRLKSECRANDFMIQERVKEYVALGNEPISSNYIDLANCLGTHDYVKVKKELSKYLVH